MGPSQTPLGNDGMRKILLSTNTPPPSRKSLQKTSNKVMSMIESVNEADMSHRCRRLVDVNTIISCYLNLESEAREKNNLNTCTIIPNQVIKHFILDNLNIQELL